MRPTDVILLNGTSSSGKSSLARALQSRAGLPLLHASLDTFTDMYRWDAISDPAERQACHTNGVANFHATLRLLAAGPHALVVDHVLEWPDWFRATAAALAGRSVHCIGVRCPLDILAARERARGDRHPGLAAGQFERVHQGLTYDFEIDTSRETPESGADKILAHVNRATA